MIPLPIYLIGENKKTGFYAGFQFHAYLTSERI